ncbi:putative polyubiquitin [Piedraia hortae CBS 480.64]|uniref:Putative polyubiquitin n=1 Tax=Piedraia hortae CBS 480.64 TaxID=1314780 RepID=A0A6A7CAD1_9PEZI|nr:putative polyubiquitin [Piedraia hortae CBS 480.64]
MRTTQRFSADGDEQTQIFVKDVTGDAFSLSIPTATTVETFVNMVALRSQVSPDDLRVVYAGRQLQVCRDDSSPAPPTAAARPTLADHGITHESTIYLAGSIRGGAQGKKVRCTYSDCREFAQRIVGDCSFCTGHFCSRHRMLENHSCPGLEDCKNEEKQRNKEKLERERTKPVRGLGTG